MPRFSVDGVEYEAAEGQTILQALDEAGVLMNGVDVPHYCWHPKLAIDGSCRLCQVEVEGMPKLQIACNTPVSDGMVVYTQNDRVTEARKGVMELLLVNHPLDCPICDQAGECKLQDYAFEYGALESRTQEPRRALKKKYELGPTVLLDQERCILCRRCVRFCREVPETDELSVFGRGDESVIDTFPGIPLENDYSMNVADICPVGALTTKDFRFKVRVWFLEDVESLCGGCSKGCNIHMGVANNKVYRYVPRRNDQVNDTWICDGGRMSYKEIESDDRLDRSQVRGADGVLETRPFASALEEAGARLQRLIDEKGAGVIAGVASAHASNEDLFTFKRFLDAMGTEIAGVPVVRGASDRLLIQADKAANFAGARAIGFNEADALVERIRGGGVDGLVILGHDLIDSGLLASSDALLGIDTVIVIDTHQSDLIRVADVVLPARHLAEKRGTFTNHAGRVQRVHPAVEPSFEAHDEGALLFRLGQVMALPGFDGSYSVPEASKALSEAVAVFRGCDLGSLGPEGALLDGAARGER